MNLPLPTLLLLLFAILGNASANILIKAGANRIGPTDGLANFILKAVTSPAIICGAILFVVVLGAYSAVLVKVPLSVAYPLMTSLGFIIVVLASSIFFKESIHPLQVVGMVLILFGLWLVARYLGAR
jgi:multidrug transporter EmrE-like cation transporter